jgi:hypothetical protein
MGQNELQQLIGEIESRKRELVEIALEVGSLVHYKLLSKSRELDDLIVQYLKLMNRKSN